MKKNLRPLTVLLACLLATVTFYIQAFAESEPDDVTLVIHKLLLGDSHSSDELLIQNDGSENPEGLDLLQNQVGLNDVEFSVYDQTKEFYELRASGKTVEESQQLLSKKEVTQEPVISGVTQKVGSEDGLLSLNVPKKQKNQDAVYLIKETKRPENVKEKSIPLVIVLPVHTDKQQELDMIHLYIKNEREKSDMPNLEKIINHDLLDFSYGETISYTIKTDIPQDILQYKSYVLEDEADPSLWLIKKDSASETIKVSIDGVEATDFYQITEMRDHGFTIAFKPDKLSPYTGKTINITYEMELRSGSSAQVEFPNTVTLIPGDKPKIEATRVVYTGGYHFVKVDLDNHNKVLAGAKFIVENDKKEYLTENKKGRSIWSKDMKKAKKVTSNTEGRLEVQGLKFGDYNLKEIEAPKGYTKSNQRIPFTVTKTSEKETNKSPLKLVNKQEPIKLVPGSIVPSGKLPQTNETSNRWLSVIGIFLIGFTIIKIKGDKKNEEI